MSRSASPLPDLLLERLALDEVSPAERAELEARLAVDADARARFAALSASSGAILHAHPPARIAAQIEARLAAGAARRRPRWQLTLSVALPAAALAGVLAVTLLPEEARRPGLGTDAEVTRVKGLAPTLAVHRKLVDRSERLVEGAPASAGDTLQVSYVAAGRGHGVILSVDGRGAVTLHHPQSVDGDTTLLAGGEAALPHAYELDDAPGFERFFLVTRAGEDTPLEVDTALAAAKELAAVPARARRAPLPLPDGWEQTSVTVVKADTEATP
jgi:hypothetical protein